MADPTKYTISYSFSGWQASNPAKPLPAQHVDDQFAGIRTSIGQLVDAVKDVRRSDGKLKNASVTIDSLADEVKVPWTGGAINAWAPVVAYTSGLTATPAAPATVVVYSGETYVCLAAHTTTSVFDPTKWVKIAAKGTPGAGTGDMVTTNNLSDVADIDQARANLNAASPADVATALSGYLSKNGNLAGLADKAAARANLALATVAASGAYGDLAGKPALGSAASRDVGTAAGQLVELLAGGKLPAVDGSLLTDISAVGLKNVRLITASGNITPSAGVTKWLVLGVGGGGGGSGGGAGGPTGGGGGGGGFLASVTVDPSTSYAAVIGAGGAGGAYSSANGGTGGSTTLTIRGTTLTASGGGGGSAPSGASAIAAPGDGGSGSGGLLNAAGQRGSPGSYASGGSRGGSGGVGAFSLGRGAGADGNTTGAGSPGVAGCLLILEF